MSDNYNFVLDIPEINIKIYPGSILLLRLLIHSKMSESWLFRPTIDDWKMENGQIIEIMNLIDPAFSELLPGSKLNQVVTFFIPSDLKPGQILKSWLRFPALAEESIPIEAEILLPTQQKEQPQIVEASFSVTLPLNSQENLSSSAIDRSTSASFGLISGLIDLDKIPSRWLVAELLVILCQAGNEYIETELGKQLLNQLKTTRFFENGVRAFVCAQVPNWIAHSLNTVDKSLSHQSLLSIWEQWLFDLVPEVNLDVTHKTQTRFISPVLTKDVVSELGEAADRWFAGIVLGLAINSAKVMAALTTTTHSNQNVLMGNLETIDLIPVINTLSMILQSLDILPARWLVVELLFLVCQKGNQYAQTQSGSQFLEQLSSTGFFNNGVVAFSSAQVPRWLAISHQAAIAYQASASSALGQGGLLDVTQQCLWSLGLTDLNHSSLKNDISTSGNAADTLISSCSMDAQVWFGSLVLGLALLSPKIADLCCREIASNLGVTSFVPSTKYQPTSENIFHDRRSLTR
ncbi:MAG: hypothetical protein C6Y22_30585 [Hapalosiphonaceae cyanobacterium JJU2]|nr:MAG: hypothetical protein C6Y22_30585 [Hapalosiphonaceae cyanobacterium JJU2]